MSVRYDVEAKVISQKGTCPFGHKVGDTIYFDGKAIRGDVCYNVLLGLLPRIYAMRYGVEFPFRPGDGVSTYACPDDENPVVFEVRRIRK